MLYLLFINKSNVYFSTTSPAQNKKGLIYIIPNFLNLIIISLLVNSLKTLYKDVVLILESFCNKFISGIFPLTFY
jgi:hypothetical protein